MSIKARLKSLEKQVFAANNTKQVIFTLDPDVVAENLPNTIYVIMKI